MELAYFIAVILIASVLQGITGFGSALVAAPLLLLVVDKTTSVISLMFVSVALNALLLYSIKYPIDKKTFYNFFIPSLVGMPIGIIILNMLDVEALRILVGLLSFVFAFLLFSKSFHVESTKFKRMFAGWFSGVLHTSMSLNGPPVVLLMARENTDKDEMRKTLALLFMTMSIVSIFMFIFTNNITPKVISYGLWGIPVAVLGGWIGHQISKHVSQKQFIWSVFVLISITIIVSIYSGVKDYIN